MPLFNMKGHVAVVFLACSLLFLVNESSGFTLSQKVLMTDDTVINSNDQQISPEADDQNIVRRDAPDEEDQYSDPDTPEGEDHNLEANLSNPENESQSDVLMEEVEEASNSSSSEESDDSIGPIIEIKKLPSPKSPNEKCTAPPEIGMCRAAFPMFYYDPSSSTCQQFVYGGCGGNDNQYKTAEECYRICNNNVTRASPRGASTGQDYLVLANGRRISEITFKSEPYVYIASDKLEEFSINQVYQFEFSIKTDRPDGLIAFLRQESVPEELQGARIQLYIYMKKGHLAVTHVFGNHSEKIEMERGGLQHGNLHHCIVSVSAKTGELTMEVDHFREKFIIRALQDMPQYGSSSVMLSGFKSALWVGGIKSSEHESEDVIESHAPLHGCLDHFSLLSGQSLSSLDLTRVTNLETTLHSGVKEGCSDLCRSQNRCDKKAKCINHFDHTSCDCLGSYHDGETCDIDEDDNIMTLGSEGHVVHRLYDWMNRVQTYSTIFSISFRTGVADSILFYGSSVYPEEQYIALSLLKNGSAYLEVDLGDGAVSAVTDQKYDNKIWQTLTVLHRNNIMEFYDFKTIVATLKLPGPTYYFHLDPDFYIGDAPLINKACGLPVNSGRNESFCSPEDRYFYDPATQSCSTFNYTGCGGNGNNFADEESCLESCQIRGLPTLNSYHGCLRSIFYNDVSILRSLRDGKKSTSFKGLAQTPPLGKECKQKTYVPLTFSTLTSSLVLPLHEPLEKFCLKVHFRPNNTRGVLASGNVTVYDSPEQWELQYTESYVMFYIHDELLKTKVQMKITPARFYHLELHCMGNSVKLIVNGKSKEDKFPGGFVFDDKLTLGKGVLEDSEGFVGCVRNIHVNGEFIDPRVYVDTHLATRDVTLDSCRVLGPCERPDACQHGAICTPLEGGGVECDCGSTGYAGKSCHFSKYKKSCEQYHVVGYRETGIYKIDLDGDGPLRPTYVRCKFDEITGETTTFVHHNLKDKYEVRRKDMDDFTVKITYRDFDDELLTNLVDNSGYCSQRVTYDCIRAPLDLSLSTWFASPAKNYFSNFGTKNHGLCPCKETDSCYNDKVACNCDINDNTPRRDVAIFKEQDQIPLTSAVFKQSEYKDSRTDGKITVGPLECKKEATESHVVSFKTLESYLEIPAWRKGEIDFSFKTSSSRPIIAYQPSSHPTHASFKIAIVDDNTIEFMYKFGDTTGSKRVRSIKQLNNGQWQHIMVDYDEYQLRIVVNEREEFFDFNFDAEQKLGLYDGSLFLGGVPKDIDIIGDEEDNEGFLGCIRAFLMNNDVVDLKRYTRIAVHGVSSECRPSCESNPCKNGATCVEQWGAYECICENPIAHSGKNCENNLNDDAVTLTTIDSKFYYFVNTTKYLNKYSLILNGFTGNLRTFSTRGQIFFAVDHLHNFVQLYLDNENTLVYKYNIKKAIHELKVVTDDDSPINTGQSIQITVERQATTSSMSLYFDGKFFNGTEEPGISLIGEGEYNQYPFGSSRPYDDVVKYPHSLTKPSQYYMAYLGSVNDVTKDVHSTLPGIIGCLRGLRIGGRRWYLAQQMDYSNDVKPGCRMACDDLKPCQNGGHCIEDFGNHLNFQCKCDHTSYHGKTCAQETAYSFSGKQWIGLASESSPISGSFKLELAFSTSSSSPNRQIVALLRSLDESTSHDYLSVNVEPNGEITIEAAVSDIDPDQVHGYTTMGINAHDLQRQHVVVQRNADTWILKVNGIDREMSPMRDAYDDRIYVMVNNVSLYIGGAQNGIDDRTASSANFHGCISNILLTTNDEEMDLLKEYSSGSQKFAQSESDDIGKVNKCGAFFVDNLAGIVIGESENSSLFMGGEWVMPEIKRSRYYAVVREPVVRDTRMDDTVPTVAGLFLALIFVIVIAYLVNLAIKSNKHKKQQPSSEENEPLFNGNKNSYEEETVKGTYYDKSPDMLVNVENGEKEPLMSKGAGEHVELEAVKTTPTHTETPTTTTTTTAQIESPQPVDIVIIGEPEELQTSEAPPKPQRQLMDESFVHEKSVLGTPGSKSSSDDESEVENVPEIMVTEELEDFENTAKEKKSPSEPSIDVVGDTAADEAIKSSTPEPVSDTVENTSTFEAPPEELTSLPVEVPTVIVTESSETVPEQVTEVDPETVPEASKELPKVDLEDTPKAIPVEAVVVVQESENALPEPEHSKDDVTEEKTVSDTSTVSIKEPDTNIVDDNIDFYESLSITQEVTSEIKEDNIPQMPSSPPPKEQSDNNVQDISLSISETSKESPSIDSDIPLPPPPAEITDDTAEDKSISEVSNLSNDETKEADTLENQNTVSQNGITPEPSTVLPEEKLQEDSQASEVPLDLDAPLPPPPVEMIDDTQDIQNSVTVNGDIKESKDDSDVLSGNSEIVDSPTTPTPEVVVDTSEGVDNVETPPSPTTSTPEVVADTSKGVDSPTTSTPEVVADTSEGVDNIATPPTPPGSPVMDSALEPSEKVLKNISSSSSSDEEKEVISEAKRMSKPINSE